MQQICFLFGVLLYLGILADIVQTTLSMQGGGWITNHLSHLIPHNAAGAMDKSDAVIRISSVITFAVCIFTNKKMIGQVSLRIKN